MPSRFAVRAMRTAISPRLAMRTEENMAEVLSQADTEKHGRRGLSSGRGYCLASGLSDSGAFPDFFAGGGRRAADAGAEFVGRGSGAGAAVCAGGGLVGAAAC